MGRGLKYITRTRTAKAGLGSPKLLPKPMNPKSVNFSSAEASVRVRSCPKRRTQHTNGSSLVEQVFEFGARNNVMDSRRTPKRHPRLLVFLMLTGGSQNGLRPCLLPFSPTNVSKVVFQVYGPLTAGAHMQQKRSVSLRSFHSGLIVWEVFSAVPDLLRYPKITFIQAYS